MAIVTASELREVLGVGVRVSDATLEQKIAAAEGILIPYLKTTDQAGVVIDYADVPNVKEAVLNASVDLFRQNSAPGGNYSSIDFTPSPWALGRSFFDRYEGLLAGYINVKSLIG